MSRILVVTGGSRGIGAATCLEAARRGYSVAVNYSAQVARAEAVVAQIRAHGGTAIAVQADVANETAIIEMFARVDRELGRVDALVNNAGIIGGEFRIDATSGAQLSQLWAVNLTGSLLCAREAVKRMSTRHGGSGGVIVNLSSAAARLGGAGGLVPYAVSKAGIDTFTNGLAREVAEEGIRVCAASPGVIDTEIQPPGRVAMVAPQIPMRRAGSAEEVAHAILWLLSDEASYVSGAVLGISGAR